LDTIESPIQSRHGGIVQDQGIAQIDPREIGFTFHRASAEIAVKDHLWMENS